MTAVPPADGASAPRSILVVTQFPAPRAPAVEIVMQPAFFAIACDVGAATLDDIRVLVRPRHVVITVMLPPTFPLPRPESPPFFEFERVIPLPSDVRLDGTDVRLTNGVLEVIVRKRGLGGVGNYWLPEHTWGP